MISEEKQTKTWRKLFAYGRKRKNNSISVFFFVLLLIASVELHTFYKFFAQDVEKVDSLEITQFHPRYSSSFEDNKRHKKSYDSTPSWANATASLEPISQTSYHHGQRIVILAGPHKTGTTSIQNNMMKWTSADNNLLKNWAWPVPPVVEEVESRDGNNWEWTIAKGFYAMMESFTYRSTKGARLIFQEYDVDFILDQYKSEFLKAWKEGKNLVLGSEAGDFVVKDEDGERITDDLLKLMPWNTNSSMKFPGSIEDVTMTVTYREPRVKHLMSVWHEHEGKRPKKERNSFYNWIATTKNMFGAIDSLRMAEIFIDKGLKVVLIDTLGVSKNKLDISFVVACDVLKVACTEDKRIAGLDEDPIIKNVRKGEGFVNMSKAQLDEMEKVLKKFDCNYRHLVKNKNLTLLFGETLLKNFKKCEDNEGGTRMERSQMKEDIVKIALKTTDPLPLKKRIKIDRNGTKELQKLQKTAKREVI